MGSTLTEDVWKEPVVCFTPVPGKVPVLPEEVVKDLSRDQLLGYKYCHAIMTGKRMYQTFKKLHKHYSI